MMVQPSRRRCSSCGVDNPPKARFCNGCGAVLPLDVPRPQAPAPKTTTSRLWPWFILAGALMVAGLMIAAVTDDDDYEPSGLTAGDDDGGLVRVRYEVTGSTSQADITYSDANGSTSQQSGIDVPMQTESGQTGLSFTMVEGEFLYISAQNVEESGSITCRITADGVVIDEATSHGGYVIATCSGTA